jgi:hypothetical protein
LTNPCEAIGGLSVRAPGGGLDQLLEIGHHLLFAQCLLLVAGAYTRPLIQFNVSIFCGIRDASLTATKDSSGCAENTLVGFSLKVANTAQVARKVDECKLPLDFNDSLTDRSLTPHSPMNPSLTDPSLTPFPDQPLP